MKGETETPREPTSSTSLAKLKSLSFHILLASSPHCHTGRSPKLPPCPTELLPVMEKLSTCAAVSAGKGVAAAVPLCNGMPCLDTHEWLSLREKVSALHMQWWWAPRNLHYKVPKLERGCVPKDAWELVQPLLTQEAGSNQTQLVRSNSQSPNQNHSSWACVKNINVPGTCWDKQHPWFPSETPSTGSLVLSCQLIFTHLQASPTVWRLIPAPRDDLGVPDTPEELRVLPMGDIHPRTTSSLVTSSSLDVHNISPWSLFEHSTSSLSWQTSSPYKKTNISQGI